MNRNVKIVAAVAAIVIGGGCVIYSLAQAPVSANPEFAQWEPTAAAIRKSIGPKEAPASGMTDAGRRSQFCDLFKSRFRMHEPKVAVGVRFVTPGMLKLMCPARMEPCYIDQIALSLWHEAREDFGSPVNIEIYNTFIGTNNVKIGQLRPLPDNPDIARITYDYSLLMHGTHIPRRPVHLLPLPRTIDQTSPSQSHAPGPRAVL